MVFREISCRLRSISLIFEINKLGIKRKKIIPNSGSCVSSCSTSSTPYLYEYLGKCYEKCPNGTANINYICYECDSDCKECESNNVSYCLSCKDPDKYLDKGKCVSACTYGAYVDSNSNKFCCNLEKCSQCSKESIAQNLCTACSSGYYPKYTEDQIYFY